MFRSLAAYHSLFLGRHHKRKPTHQDENRVAAEESTPRGPGAGSRLLPCLLFPLLTFLIVLATYSPLAADANGGKQIPKGKLTLDQCVAIALENNTEVIVAERQAEIAGAQVKGSWSNILPTMNATLWNSNRSQTGARVFERDVPVGIDPNTGKAIYERRQTTQDPRTLTNYSANVSLSQNIYDGGRWWNTIRQNRAQEKAAYHNSQATRQRIAWAVKQKYYQLLEALRLQEVAEEAVKLSEEQVQRTQSMYEVGAVARVDVYRVQATLGNDKIDLINRKKAVLQAKGDLNITLGFDAMAPIDIVDELDLQIKPANLNLEQMVATAMANNPDLAQLRANVNAARLGVKVAKSANWPTISAFAAYGRSGTAVNNVYNDPDLNWSVTVGLTASINLFSGLQTSANIERAQLNFLQAAEQLEDGQRQTTLAIQQAILDLQAQAEIVDISRSNIEASQEDLRLAQERYRVGAGTLLDVIDAQVNLTRARSSLVSAQYRYKIAQATLEQAMGTLLAR